MVSFGSHRAGSGLLVVRQRGQVIAATLTAATAGLLPAVLISTAGADSVDRKRTRRVGPHSTVRILAHGPGCDGFRPLWCARRLRCSPRRTRRLLRPGRRSPLQLPRASLARVIAVSSRACRAPQGMPAALSGKQKVLVVRCLSVGTGRLGRFSQLQRSTAGSRASPAFRAPRAGSVSRLEP
jgi:hypothetical protein